LIAVERMGGKEDGRNLEIRLMKVTMKGSWEWTKSQRDNRVRVASESLKWKIIKYVSVMQDRAVSWSYRKIKIVVIKPWMAGCSDSRL
jgi:hypothetical protein